MTPPSEAPSAQFLLEHSEWLRALARSLVRDPNLADDLSQEACLAALEHPPGTVFSRGWFATVLRNVLRQERRGDGRREDRERKVSRDEELPSTLDLVSQVSMQRDLAQCVTELEEPYRRAILLRYFESLPPRVIASRLGVPTSTVKTWLSRGLERLRARLDDEHAGDRIAWATLLLPLTREPGIGTAASSTLAAKGLGILLMSTKIKIVAGVVLALGAVVLWRGLNAEDSSARGLITEEASLERETASSADELDVPERGTVEIVAGEHQREDIAQPAVTDGSKVSPALPASVAIGGLVLDSEGKRLSSIRIGDELDETSTVTSSADGSFTINLDRRGGAVRLVCRAEGYTTVYTALVNPTRPDIRPVVVVAPTLHLAGRVIDEVGTLVPEARIEFRLPNGFRSRFGAILDHVSELSLESKCDPEGRFELADVPQIRDAELVASHPNHVRTEVPAPAFADEQMTIVLPGVATMDGLVRGQVVDANGAPVPGAKVSLGFEIAVTDESGLFSIPIDDPQGVNARFSEFVEVSTSSLLAVKAGMLPTRVNALSIAENGAGEWPDFVRVELTGKPLSISGWVRDEEGEGLEGIQVWTEDLLLLGGDFNGMTLVEFELRDNSEVGEYFVLTDASGGFELGGLMEKPYRLQAMDATTLQRISTAEIRAGEEHVEIVLPSHGMYDELSGRIVDRDGRALAGLSVRPMCDAFRMRYEEQVISTRHEALDAIETDDEGRFTLKRVPEDLVYLRIDGTDVIPLEWGRHVEGGLAKLVGERADELEITVGRRCHFRVELADPERADSFSVLDGEGNTLILNVFTATGRRELPVLQLSEGRSDSAAVRDTGQTLVLFKGDAEVSRVALTLVAGELTVVTP